MRPTNRLQQGAVDQQHGATLVELIMVMSIMGIVMQLAMPATEALRPSSVDAGVREVVEALRFARAEAIRSGDVRVAAFDPANARIRVYALDLSVKPPVEDPSVAVIHPLDKKAYDVSFARSGVTSSLAIDSAVFTFSDKSTATAVAFGADGTPERLVGNKPTDVKPLSATGVVQVSAGAFRRTVSLDATTGRVTAQP